MKRILFLISITISLASSLIAQTTQQYTSYTVVDSALIIQTNSGFLKIKFFTEEVVEMSFSPTSLFPGNSDAVLPLKQTISFALQDEGSSLFLATKKMEIIINKQPVSIAFINEKGDTVTREITGGFTERMNHGFRFELAADEKITGGGARALPMNRRGYALKLNNEPHWGYAYGEQNLNYSVPVFMSSRNYLVFYDAPQRATADIGKTQPEYFDLYSSMPSFSCFVMVGHDYTNLLHSYTQLTGTQPIPPRWAFGNLQSRFGYKSQIETINKTDSIIAAGYPLDAMIVDLYWFGKGLGDFRMGDLWWEKENWPNPETMIKSLKDKGVKTILITEPYILETSQNFREADSLQIMGKDSAGNTFVVKDFWFGPAGIIDVFNPKAIDWFWAKYKRLKQQGIEGWWGDLGEPEKHPSGIHYVQGTSDNIHNIYGHYCSKMLADKYKFEFPNDRLFFLNRAGFAGSQRYSVFPWSGDVSRSWSGFRAQLPIMLGMSLNGIPYMHSDLGGFAAGTKDEELYIRWLQFGVFNPIFRPHGESIPSEPIYFSEKTQQIVREFIKLRYRLMPYNYTLAWRQATMGEPLAHPMMYARPKVKEMFDIDSAYFWGSSFLVAPVLTKGQKKREVYLPDGYWFSFFNKEEYEGKTTVKIPVNLETIPVFVRAGSFIPMVRDFQSTDKYPNDSIFMRYYNHESVKGARYTLFEDDGKDRLSLENGKFETTLFRFKAYNNFYTFDITGSGGVYPGKPLAQTIVLTVYNIKDKPKSVLVNNKEPLWNYNKKEKQLNITFIKTESIQISVNY
jgi:oligosaccharide 4-alpha-D-glucosyltransferase